MKERTFCPHMFSKYNYGLTLTSMFLTKDRNQNGKKKNKKKTKKRRLLLNLVLFLQHYYYFGWKEQTKVENEHNDLLSAVLSNHQIKYIYIWLLQLFFNYPMPKRAVTKAVNCCWNWYSHYFTAGAHASWKRSKELCIKSNGYYTHI